MDNESRAFVAIDIGTSVIKIIAMQSAQGQINVTGVGVAQSKGMHKGMVVDIEQTINDIKAAEADLNKKSKVPVDQVSVGIPAGYLTIESLRGSIELSQNPREINENDLKQLISSILKEHETNERDFVGIAVENFIVDNFDGISDPLGMIGSTLMLKCKAYSIPKTIFRNILKSVQGAGFKVANVVLNPIANAEVALNNAQREMGAVLIDSGSGQTSLNIFQNNILLKSDTVFEGGGNVTSDISKILQISEQEAEPVKIDYGSLKTQEIRNNESFVIKTLDQSEEVEVGDRYLSEIINARYEQIFSKIKKYIETTNALELPGGIMITGGNSALPGCEDKVSDILGKKTNIYLPNQIGLRNQIYTTVYGVVIHTLNRTRVQQILENTLNKGDLKTDHHKNNIDIEEDNLSNNEKLNLKKEKTPKKKKNSGIISSIKRLLYNLFE